MRGTGRATFAAILLLIVGTLNVVYGIGALDSANIFVNDTRFILNDLNTLGLGADRPRHRSSSPAASRCWPATPTAGSSGSSAGSLGAIGALFSIGGANPWWSLAIFFLCVWIVYGIIVLGEDERAPAT